MVEQPTGGAQQGAQSETQYVSVGEAAKLLGVHRNTVHNRIKAGRIRAHKVIEGDREVYRIDPESLGVGRTETLEHHKGAHRTIEGQEIAQVIADRLEVIVQGYAREVGDIREQLGEERAKRVQAERERDELRLELEALREARESPQNFSEDAYLTHAPPTPEHPTTRPSEAVEEDTLYGTSAEEAEDSLQRRSSWWRRFFGFE